jgi:transcriptional regulator with XRE-family HTH domain
MRFSARANAEIGTVIREIRTELGISQEELAHRCGRDRTYYSAVERGVRNPTVASLLRIADALEVPASEIFARAEAAHSDAADRRPREQP